MINVFEQFHFNFKLSKKLIIKHIASFEMITKGILNLTGDAEGHIFSVLFALSETPKKKSIQLLCYKLHILKTFKV